MAESESGLSEVEITTGQWQRLAPVAILYFAMRAIRTVVSNLIYLVPVLAVNFKKLDALTTEITMGVSAVLAVIVVYAILAYVVYRYRLSDERVEVRSGVFAKKHLDLPFARIQNVKIEEPFFYRPFGYACLELDTAGSASQEAKVVAVKLTLARQLKDAILAIAKAAPINDEGGESTASAADAMDETVINRRAIKDLVIHGLTNNRVWILLGALAPFLDDLFGVLADQLSALGINIDAILSDQTMAWWQIGLYAVSVAMVIMMVMALLSVIGSIVVFYGFTLSRTSERYVRRCGLLTRQEVSMKLSRIQLVARKQDWLDVILGRNNLVLEQNTSGYQHNNQLNSASKILVPSVTNEECAELIEDALPDNQLGTLPFHAISRRFLIRPIVLYWLPIVVLGAVLAIVQSSVTIGAGVAGGALLLLGLIYLRWYRWGYAMDEDFLYVRSGVLGVDQRCFPLYKLQQAQFLQSWMMRRHHIATVRIVLASGFVDIPCIPESDAMNMIDLGLFTVESQQRSWM